ncbi:MAG: right-handed parallel beta-helix repeat-containing protein [Candidatus Nitricoxidivorans perseverans]|uniref:Right-handed parallel beta-helix repeat-containing protein n=1 Tax=Candidatus Nitricoxidivorans perseverans TaxID=2975601 RepID=A0AA49IU87_9PROT|nr:MAG: right-handed parallel beta-helix repeat-containing protein [Candidatus Nitricoxidivorans perseverans]
MSGDYSRVRFDPRDDRSGVLMQQGRVQLDSDWNEWVAVLDRRLRAESVDTFGVHPTPGIAGVAVVSPQTPDAFKIEASGGAIAIGRGRMYVDGLLAENHGGGATEFDPVLAESRGKTALDYSQQPYFPTPPALPSGGQHLAYLEVWQRELTHLQQPGLVEQAVGVDTTTRMQTVWQVRLLTNVGDADCATPDAEVAGWQTLVAPSAGRMSIKAEGVPPDLDPCELPPGGGYRGLENQLYRIEIHDGGAAGAATFKWSRDNASVASNVTEIISATELRLASLGRDAVLRFNTGDWVEILDDRRELGGENGDPAKRRGVMRKITVDDAKQTIKFSPGLPADLIPGGGLDTLEARHTRVTRWDQKGTVRDADDNVVANLDAAGSTGLIPVPAANVWVVLENGIRIQFGLDPSGGQFRCGDYWVSAARTANASVETFTQAPPRGIHRHYARLAIVGLPDGETDCRQKWPPDCGGGCCTINVAPGGDIQAALDSLPEEGGCVCLKTGVHDIGAPLQILSSRVILRGESPGAIVRGAGLGGILWVGNADAPVSDVVIERLRFEATAAATDADIGALLRLESCARVRVERCALIVEAAEAQMPPPYAGIHLNGAADVELIANRLENCLVGIFCDGYPNQGELRIADNAIGGIVGAYTGHAGTYLDHEGGEIGQGGDSLGQFGIRIDTENIQTCRIENNRIRHFQVGVSLGQQAMGSLVADNRISRSAGTILGKQMPTSVAQLRNHLDSRLYAIDVEAPLCEARGNQIDLRSAAWGGIRVSGHHATVAANLLAALLPGGGMLLPAGIYCTVDAQNGQSADHAVVRDNHLLGPQAGIVVSRVAGPCVRGNHVDGAGGGWFGARVDDCTGGRIDGNDLRAVFFAAHLSDGERNRVTGNHVDLAGSGITSTGEADLEVGGNTLQSCLLPGIALFVRGTTAVLGNRVLNCGQAPALSMGIAVYAEEIMTASSAHLRIEDCEVLDTGISADGNQIVAANAVGIGGWVPACQIGNNRVGYTQPDKLDPLREHRALLLIGPLALHYDFAATDGVSYVFGGALVSGNHFSGPGCTHLVEFMSLELTEYIGFRFEKLTFSNNLCDHLGAQPSTHGSSVRLEGSHLIVMGNHVKAATGVNAMSLANRNKVALMGNVTTGGYLNVGAVTPMPIANFNVRI